jgi:hypothetical protein
MEKSETCGHESAGLDRNGECPICAARRVCRSRKSVHDDDLIGQMEYSVLPLVYAVGAASAFGLLIKWWPW